ncbi:MAG: phosphomethylpyrimidine synthase [Candidatus Hydrothermarchaeota archaeon]|nr:phosphomethylpyrimidine synthase [Candidatus Hydrothermarchaeota archaeon]
MTQMKQAKSGEITEEVRAIAKKENVAVEKLQRSICAGRTVIPKNVIRENVEPVGIGSGLRVKVNANLGTSPEHADLKEEIEKARVAVECGADTIMDLSTGGDLDKIRKEMLRIPVPLGSVPIYQAGVEAAKEGKLVDMGEEEIFKVIEKQAKDGVDFMTLHVGLTLESLQKLLKQGRLTGIVSRGGSFLATWMLHNERENPLYKNYEHVLDIAEEYDVTLSLGDALRPGSIKDSTDRAQIQELIILGELVEEARKRSVQCMVEGPGHMRMNEIEANVILQKKLCGDAPFYVLGPLVTDIAPGYDHITAAIGGAMAALAGADFLCYVTPAEHLALPSIEDVRQGVIAAKIAAHAADIARGIDLDRDDEMAKARADLNWSKQFKLCLDPKKAMEFRKKRLPHTPEVCSMCEEFCAMKIAGKYLKKQP